MATANFTRSLRKAKCTRVMKAYAEQVEGKLVAALLAEYCYHEESGEVRQMDLNITMPDHLPGIRQSLISELEQLEEERYDEFREDVHNIFVGCFLTPNGYKFYSVINNGSL